MSDIFEPFRQVACPLHRSLVPQVKGDFKNFLENEAEYIGHFRLLLGQVKVIVATIGGS